MALEHSRECVQPPLIYTYSQIWLFWVSKVLMVLGFWYITNHNTLLLHHLFTIHPSTGVYKSRILSYIRYYITLSHLRPKEFFILQMRCSTAKQTFPCRNELSAHFAFCSVTSGCHTAKCVYCIPQFLWWTWTWSSLHSLYITFCNFKLWHWLFLWSLLMWLQLWPSM